MVTVRVVRGASIGAAAFGASGLLTQNAGCAAPVEPSSSSEQTGAAASAVTVQAPGSATLSLDYSYDPYGWMAFKLSDSADEFVRVGEKLTLHVPAWWMWSQLHATDPLTDEARAKQLQAKITVLFLAKGATIDSRCLTLTSWVTDPSLYNLVGVTDTIVVPEGADQVQFLIDLSDAGDASAAYHLTASAFAPVYVFGADLPNKHVLFDTNGSAYRARVIEGGAPVKGSTVDLSYTDWRAATLVDSSKLDKQIGTAKSYSRFGEIEMPIYGELQYEVSYGWFADDGEGWHGETPLGASTGAREVPFASRTTFEGSLFAPRAASKIDLYFHVKAYLVVDYSKWGNVTSRRYDQGARVLLKETWDNPNGAYTNYELRLED